MSMRITRRDVALLRAYVRRNLLKTVLLSLLMPPRNRPSGGTLLLHVAFQLAARRRFIGKTRADLIRFVAHARIRRGQGPPWLRPTPAEKLLVAACTGDWQNLNLTQWQRAQSILLLGELVEDENMTDEEVDRFVTESVTEAERHADRPKRAT